MQGYAYDGYPNPNPSAQLPANMGYGGGAVAPTPQTYAPPYDINNGRDNHARPSHDYQHHRRRDADNDDDDDGGGGGGDTDTGSEQEYRRSVYRGHRSRPDESDRDARRDARRDRERGDRGSRERDRGSRERDRVSRERDRDRGSRERDDRRDGDRRNADRERRPRYRDRYDSNSDHYDNYDRYAVCSVSYCSIVLSAREFTLLLIFYMEYLFINK